MSAWFQVRAALGAGLVCTAAALAAAAGPTAPPAHAASAQRCADPYPAARDPANPLDLPHAPGADPLVGACFFVDGPAPGAAAGAIARRLGRDPASYANTLSWASFWHTIQPRLRGHRRLTRQVDDLAKIAVQPEVQRVSIYADGGGPGAIFGQTQKLLCSNAAADAGSVMLINTYLLHPALGGCATAAQINAYMPVFERRVEEVDEAVENRPVVFLLETDALGSSSCMARHGALLNAIGIRAIRGFYTNDTHEDWTINEVRWATAVARRTGGTHFIVNTAATAAARSSTPTR